MRDMGHLRDPPLEAFSSALAFRRCHPHIKLAWGGAPLGATTTQMSGTRGVLLLLACVPASAALQLPRLRPLPRRLEAIVLDADGSFLDPDHKVSPANAEVTLALALAKVRARA